VIEFSEFQRDAVSEVLNVAIGRAAAALNRMVGEEVRLTIPHAALVSRAEAARRIESRSPGDVGAVRQHFSGGFSGSVLLVLPEGKSLELAHAIMGDGVEMEILTELEVDAVTEVGNILLNACLGGLANLLGLEFKGALPVYMHGEGRRLLGLNGEPGGADDMTLVVDVEFDMWKKDLGGYLLFLLDAESGGRFIEQVEGFMARSLAI